MKVTPEIEHLTDICKENSKIDVELYGKYDVKRGLRDVNGKGVLGALPEYPMCRLLKWSTEKKYHVREIYSTAASISKI